MPLIYDAAQRQSGCTFVAVTSHSLAYLFVDPPANLQVLSYDRPGQGVWPVVRELKRIAPKGVVLDLFPGKASWTIRGVLWLLGYRVTKARGLASVRRRIEKQSRVSSDGSTPGIHLFFAQTMRRVGMDVGAGAILLRPQPTKCVGMAMGRDPKGRLCPSDMQIRILRALLVALPEFRVVFYACADSKLPEEGLTSDERSRIVVCSAVGSDEEIHHVATLGCLIGTDCLSLQLAAMVGVPVVALYLEPQPTLACRPYRVPRENCIALPTLEPGQSSEALPSRVVETVRRALARE